MIKFDNDYSEGAHPKIIERLSQTNLEQTAGYGEDIYCQRAIQIIKDKCENQNIDIHFFVGGTQANLTVISAALRPHQGAVTVKSGHINIHETGAIESCGHKVISLDSCDGKIKAEQIQNIYDEHYNDEATEHMVQPKLVYISNPTELGTIYSKKELEKISTTCHKNNMYLFVDGARLGYGLTAPTNDLDLPTITNLCDIFYIGGTKVGALFGEAVIIKNEILKEDFRYIIKQKGALLAKGRLLGLQFETLFENDLYFKISQHAIDMAILLKNAFKDKGYAFQTDSFTNQQFPIIPDKHLEILKKKYEYSYLKRIDDTHSAVRFCTSWATKKENVDKLIEDIKNL